MTIAVRYFAMFASLFVAATNTAGADIIVSSNRADFVLTPVVFPTTSSFTNTNIVSTTGSMTLDNANGVGDPSTGTHAYLNFNGVLVGDEYVLNGDENFDILFPTMQTAFALDYSDESVDSVFSLEFFAGTESIGSASFTSAAPFNTSKFIGFLSDSGFDRVEVREDDGPSNTNEFFQFYNAVAIPEPSTTALIYLSGVAFVAISHRRDSRQTMP